MLTASDPNAALWPTCMLSPTPTTLTLTPSTPTPTPRQPSVPCPRVVTHMPDASRHSRCAHPQCTHACRTPRLPPTLDKHAGHLTPTCTQESQHTPNINVHSERLALHRCTRAHPRQSHVHPHTQRTVDRIIRLLVIVMKFNCISLFDLISIVPQCHDSSKVCCGKV